MSISKRSEAGIIGALKPLEAGRRAEDCHMAQGEIELVNQAARAEGGQLAAEFDDLLFDLGGSLMGLMERSAGMFL